MSRSYPLMLGTPAGVYVSSELVMATSSSLESGKPEHLARGWGASLLSPFDEARLHRLAYIEILRTYLPRHGDEKRLALALGVWPETVRYWLMADGARSPYRFAALIAESVSMTPEDRDSFVEHVRMSVVPRLRGEPAVRLTGDVSVRELADAVANEHAVMLAAHSTDLTPIATRIRNGGTSVLSTMNPVADPVLYMRVALAVWEALCFLDRPHQGFYVASVACELASGLDDRLPSASVRWTMRQLHVDAVRAEGVALHNAGRDDDALDRYSDAIRLAEARDLRSPAVLAWIGTDYLKALPGTRRFRLESVEMQAVRSDRLLEKAERDAEILTVLTREGHARAYVMYSLAHPRAGRLAMAQRLVDEAVVALARTPAAGAIHQVMVLRTVGRLHRLAGDTPGWIRTSEEARQIAAKAGLLGQLGEIERDLHPRDAPLAG